jgi:hypothetical protein
MICSSNCHRDGSLPVSLIKEYLVKKLDLASEAEVTLPLCWKKEEENFLYGVSFSVLGLYYLLKKRFLFTVTIQSTEMEL